MADESADSEYTPVAPSLQERIAPFLDANVGTEYRAIRPEYGIIKNPWGEANIVLGVNTLEDELIAALNSVLLPARFTAIWHSDTRDFEVIWGAVPHTHDERSRCFQYQHHGHDYRCEYADASERLLLIADAALQTTRLGDEFTRLPHLNSLTNFEKAKAKDPSLPYVSTSLWIRNIQWDENLLVEVVGHLNFYMRYFDYETPRIMIHDPLLLASRSTPTRYPFAVFPPAIIGRPLDPYLLSLWTRSLEGDTRLRFLYLYQIFEYASFYWVRDTVQQAIKRILSVPETYTNPNQAVRQMIDALAEEKSTDEQKIGLALRQLVDPESIWKAIELDRAYFCQDVRFDGGLVLPASYSATMTLSDFVTDWKGSGDRFPRMIRTIRNALVHGRESRMANVIAPTLANDERLRPWLDPMNAAAMQVILVMEQ